jgi:hypothetical protein
MPDIGGLSQSAIDSERFGRPVQKPIARQMPTPLQGEQQPSIEDKISQFAQSLTAEEQLAALPILQQFMQAVQTRVNGPSEAELLQHALQRGPSQPMPEA